MTERVLRLLLLAWLAGAAAWPAAAQIPAEGQAMVAARLLPGEAIRLDGRLTHPAWQRAPVHAAFVEKLPETGATPRHATRMQVLFDERALYVGVRAADPDPQQIRAPLVRHDAVNRTQDFVVVYIDAIGRRQSAQFFRVNAAGSTGDGMHTATDDSEDFAPDFDFDAAVARDVGGWTAVLRIPFASLRYSGDGASGWRIMVARRVPREQFYLHSSVLIPRDAASFIATLQPLQGVELPQRGQFLTLRPSLTVHQSRAQLPGQSVQRGNQVDASLDLKWRLRPEWVIDGTLRPDFSQVALDVPQLAGNTRFALSLPEKRPFFFESSDLLRSPSEALYTRSLTEPRWGLRSTWRRHHLAGTAFAIDDHGGGLVLLPGTWGTGVAEQPASQVVAARGLLDGGTLQWGALAVDRRYADGRGDNRVFGPDLAWQIDPSWRLRAQWLQSQTSAIPDASGALQQGPTQNGQRALVKLNWQGHSSDASLTLDDLSAGFRHDTGFVNQNGVRRLEAAAATGWQQIGPINEFWLNLRYEQIDARPGGLRVGRSLVPGLWLAGPHNLEWSLNWHGDAQLRTEPSAPLLHQRYWRSDFTVTPAQWIPFLKASGRIGRIADTLANEVRPGGDLNLSLTTRPLRRLEFEPRLSLAWLEHDGRRNYRESVAQLLAVWHVDARQSLRAIVQRSSITRLAEPGVAAFAAAGTQGSLTWAWRHSAGTVLYIGASRSRQGVAAVARGTEVFVKLQVDADDLARAF